MDKVLVQALHARGADVMTALDAGMIECQDAHHLEYATAQGRALYSFNVGDFSRLHTALMAQGKSHAGIILAQQQRYTVGDQMRRLLKLVGTKSAEDMKNQVEFLSAWG